MLISAGVVLVYLALALRGLICTDAKLFKWPMYSSIPLTLGSFEIDGDKIDPLMVVSPSWDFIGLDDLQDAFDYLSRNGALVCGSFTVLMPDLEIDITAEGSQLVVKDVRNV